MAAPGVNEPVVTLLGIPVPCWLSDGEQAFILSGVLDCHHSVVIQAGFHPLPLDRRVTVYAGAQAWAGFLTDERVWQDGTISYTLPLVPA